MRSGRSKRRARIRTVRVGRWTYRQRVVYWWDRKLQRTCMRVVEHLGPVRRLRARTREVECFAVARAEDLDWSDLFGAFAEGSWGVLEVRRVFKRYDCPLPNGQIVAIGLRRELRGSKLRLLAWMSPLSKRGSNQTQRPGVSTRNAPRPVKTPATPAGAAIVIPSQSSRARRSLNEWRR